MPARVAGTRRTSKPSCSSRAAAASTALCSNAPTTIAAAAPGGGSRPGPALDREVVGLGPAGREDDLPGRGAERSRHRLAGLLERRLRLAGGPVAARRVGEALGQERRHGLDRLGPHGRAGGVVEVGDGGVHGQEIECTGGRGALIPTAHLGRRSVISVTPGTMSHPLAILPT